jgi:hypothetical protein
MASDRSKLWIAYAITLLVGLATTSACGYDLNNNRSPSAGAGYGDLAILMGLMGLTVAALAIGLLAMPFGKFRALGGVPLAGGLGAALGLWLTALHEMDPEMIGELLYCLLGC